MNVWLATSNTPSSEIEILGIFGTQETAREACEAQSHAATPANTSEPDWAYFLNDDADPDDDGFFAWDDGRVVWEIEEFEVQS